ncbi:MAG: ammonia channel protein, partial [Nitrospirota bacterium]
MVKRLSITLAVLLLPALAGAEEAAVLDSGDTARMMISTALVMLMSIPGLALFYGGLSRTKD